MPSPSITGWRVEVAVDEAQNATLQLFVSRADEPEDTLVYHVTELSGPVAMAQARALHLAFGRVLDDPAPRPLGWSTRDRGRDHLRLEGTSEARDLW